MYKYNWKLDHRTAINQQVKEITSKLKKIKDDPLGCKQSETNKPPKKVIILTSHVKLDMCTRDKAYTCIPAVYHI